MNTAAEAVSDRTPSLARFVLYFLKLGTFGFGGPIALAGYMQHDLVDQRKWITREDYLDGLALAQLAPGPLAAQLAMYLGYVRAGFIGATAVGVAFILPSFVMVLAIALAYVRFGGLPWMQSAFYGIGAAVIGIICRSAVKLAKLTLGKDKLLWAIFAALAISTAWSEREIIWLFLLGGLIALAVKSIPVRRIASAAPAGMLVLGSLAGFGKFGDLFLYFAKAGMFVFGSGLAIVPFLYGGVVQGHHWLTDQQFVDAVAVAMITPGPVVITVSFIGYLVAGFGGATAAALGVFAPVYLVVVILAPYYKRFARNSQLHAFVQGVTAAAAGAIAGAVIVLARRSVYDAGTAVIALVSLGVLLRWKIPEPVIIILAAAAGLALHPAALFFH
ncbi:MAG TPA: chromate transporter [Terriglobales bacterium]|nr:chromate transporter [Terriglobales bacterium]